MSLMTDKPNKRLVEKSSNESREPDLIHELGHRLSCLWGFERHIDNAAGQPDLQEYWQDAKAQEQERIEELKKQIELQFLSNCF